MSTLKRVAVRLNSRDLEILRAAYVGVGYNAIIRQLVSRHARALENRSAELNDKLSSEELTSNDD